MLLVAIREGLVGCGVVCSGIRFPRRGVRSFFVYSFGDMFWVCLGWDVGVIRLFVISHQVDSVLQSLDNTGCVRFDIDDPRLFDNIEWYFGVECAPGEVCDEY